ncbi:hypothetical protein JAAARDRAFT_200407 [Jaapia argillacea MUCL 33604]|uniref:Uncharacterized protein n=1 Tax=Jaapia argillacea MUCL 33604 TaxID=933084 RepID=A0A067PG61_9AGAM|nr:hypothetical protein JAAARDRAFT_200407 [Jaapia argillacea MUCL 33604]
MSLLSILTDASDWWDPATKITPLVDEICGAFEESTSDIDTISFLPNTYDEEICNLKMDLIFPCNARINLQAGNISPTLFFTTFTLLWGVGWPLPQRLFVRMLGNGTLSVSDWKTALSGWTGLKYLMLKDGDEGALVSALTARNRFSPYSPYEDYENSVVCPSLELLALVRGTTPGDNAVVLSLELIFNLVSLRCLKGREAKGFRLKKLSLLGFTIAEADQKILEGLVDELILLLPAGDHPPTGNTSRFRRYPAVVRDALRSFDSI